MKFFRNLYQVELFALVVIAATGVLALGVLAGYYDIIKMSLAVARALSMATLIGGALLFMAAFILWQYWGKKPMPFGITSLLCLSIPMIIFGLLLMYGMEIRNMQLFEAFHKLYLALPLAAGAVMAFLYWGVERDSLRGFLKPISR